VIGDPEKIRRVLATSRKRLALSSAVVRELQDALLSTHLAIQESRAMIARSDQLIQVLSRAYQDQFS
jgi:hypothetical protein